MIKLHAESKAHPDHQVYPGIRGLWARQARKVQKELEDPQEDLDLGLLGRPDPLLVEHDPVPQGILENEGYAAIPVTVEILENWACEVERDMMGFQDIGESKVKKEMLATPVPPVSWDLPVQWEAGRVVHGS